MAVASGVSTFGARWAPSASAGSFLAPGTDLTDEISLTSLGLVAKTSVGRQTLDGEAKVTESRYFHNSELDHLAENARLAWDWLITDRLATELGARYARNLASFADTRYFHKDLLATQGYFANVTWQIGAHWDVHSEVSRAESSHSAEVLKVNDYDANTFKGGLDLVSDAGNTVGWEEQYTSSAFDRDASSTDVAFLRDYHQRVSKLKFVYAPTGKLKFAGDAAHLSRTYPNLDSRGHYSGAVWHWSADYTAGKVTSLLVAGWRELRADLDAESQYFIANGVRIGPRWAPTTHLSVQLQSSWENRRYLNTTPDGALIETRHDEVLNVGASLFYTIGYSGRLTLEYNHERRTSSLYSFGFNENRVTLGFHYYFHQTETS